MALRFQGEEVRTNQDVKELLTRIRQDPKTSNPRVLGINQLSQMKAKNGGYPQDMHHDTMEPVQVHSEKEEMALAQIGFRREYKHRDYPKFMFRRNAHPKYQKSEEEKKRINSLTMEAQRIEMATVNEDDYIEAREIRTEAEEKKLLAEKPNKAAGTSVWCRSTTEIPPFAEPDGEDPQVTIARLQGQLMAQQKAS